MGWLSGAGGVFEFGPARTDGLFLGLGRDIGRQLDPGCRKIFALEITDRDVSAANESDSENNEKCNQNETAFGKAAHSSLRRWRFDPGIRHVCARFSMSILTCASINLS